MTDELSAMTPQQRYKAKNREALRLRIKAWHLRNKDSDFYKQKNRSRVKAWREKFPDKSKAAIKKAHMSPIGKAKLNAARVRARHRRPEVLLKSRLRARMFYALKGADAKKTNTTEALIGCSFSHLRNYIESLFEPGMTWENRHLWHVDHIRPCASFDLLNSEQQRCCFHYSNLQPLWAKANWEKADKCL